MTTAELLSRLHDPKTGAVVMGILNVTPDSFSDGGQFSDIQPAVQHALAMVDVGAEIIDIGGESTRPGAEPVPLNEELNRVIPIIEAIRKQSSVLISIDTYKADVAEAALNAGADIINDISGLNFDSRMPALAAEKKCPVIVMHINGTPRTMQKNPHYDDVVIEIKVWFKKQIDRLTKQGLQKENIILDPGIGFGKRLDDNYILLKRLIEFNDLGCPILIGPSRKSFIGNLLDVPVDERLEGTLAAVCAGVMNGAKLARVHDVKEAVRALKIIDKIRSVPDRIE